MFCEITCYILYSTPPQRVTSMTHHSLEIQEQPRICHEKQKHLIWTEMINSCAVSHFTGHWLYRPKTQWCFTELGKKTVLAEDSTSDTDFECRGPRLGWWGKLEEIISYLHIKRRMHATMLKITYLNRHQIKPGIWINCSQWGAPERIKDRIRL